MIALLLCMDGPCIRHSTAKRLKPSCIIAIYEPGQVSDVQLCRRQARRQTTHLWCTPRASRARTCLHSPRCSCLAARACRRFGFTNCGLLWSATPGLANRRPIGTGSLMSCVARWLTSATKRSLSLGRTANGLGMSYTGCNEALGMAIGSKQTIPQRVQCDTSIVSLHVPTA